MGQILTSLVVVVSVEGKKRPSSFNNITAEWEEVADSKNRNGYMDQRIEHHLKLLRGSLERSLDEIRRIGIFYFYFG